MAIIERGKRIGEYVLTHATDHLKEFCKAYLGFSMSSAYQWSAIGQAEGLFSNALEKLPASWGTLYELTRLSEAEFDAALSAGKIHPEMTRADAEALRKDGDAPQLVKATGAPPMTVPAGGTGTTQRPAAPS